MENTQRNRILEKIQKCFNLSKSCEPHEAAAALRQAQKLMAKHGVTDAELGMIGYTKETVHTSIQVNRKVVPIRVNNVGVLMQKAFGVKATIYATRRVSDYNYSIDYYGKADRVVLAAYSHTVVMRALDAAWKQWLTENPHAKSVRGARASFETGWIGSIVSIVQAIALTDEDKAAVDELITRDTGIAELPTLKTAKQTLYSDVLQEGRNASVGFSLHKPIG
jgi:Protein of unknown function (DUF2786)